MSLMVALLLTVASSAPQSDVQIESCMEPTVIQFGDRDIVLTLEDGKQILAATLKFLEEEDPPLDKEVLRPGEPFIDCEGTMRFMAWVLEGTDDNDPPALRLAYRTVDSEHMIVREEIEIQRDGNEWKAVNRSEVLYHGKRP